MPRLIDNLKASVPYHNTFVGRVRELQGFRTYIRYLMGHEQPSVSERIYPHFFLLHGEGGMGKSALLRQFQRIAIDEGLQGDRIILVDLNDQQFPTVESLAQALVNAIRQRHLDFDRHYQQALRRRDELDSRYRELRRHWTRWQELHESGKLDEVRNTQRQRLVILENQVATFGKSNLPPHIALQAQDALEQLQYFEKFERDSGRQPESFEEVLGHEFGPDAQLFQSGRGLGEALAKDLYELAEAAPLLLMIDTYERADEHDNWLRLGILYNSSDRMFTVVAGRNNLEKYYKHTFSGENLNYVKAYDLDKETLEPDEVQQYLKLILSRPDDLPEELISEIQEISRGIPVALEALGNQLKEYGHIEPYRGIKLSRLDRRKVVREVTQRFLRYALADDKRDDRQTIERKLRDRQRIRALALLLRPDAVLACTLWDVSFGEGEQVVHTLASRYSFIFTGDNPYKMHDLVRYFVRKDTLIDGQQAFDWSILKAGLTRILPVIEDRLLQAEQSVSAFQEDKSSAYDDRYDDEDWREAILDLLNALLWLGNLKEATRLLLNRWVEARYSNPSFAEELTDLADDLAPKSQDFRRLIRALRDEEGIFDRLRHFNNLIERHAQAVLFFLRAREVPVWSVTDEDDLKNVNRQIEWLEQGRALDADWFPIHDALATALYKRASYRFDQRDYEGALADCEKSLEYRPDDAATLTGRGAARAILCDQRGALDDWNRSLELRPNNWETLANSGDTKFSMGNLQGALADYNTLIEIRPDDAELLSNRANIRRSMGDITGAQEDFQRSLELLSARSADPGMAVRRGSTRRSRGNIAGVEEDFSLSLDGPSESTDDPDSILRRGNIKSVMGDLTGALTEYDRLLELRPKDHTALVNRGLNKHNFGDFEGALADYGCALEVHPDDLYVISLRANTRHSVCDYSGALSDYDHILKSRPEDTSAVINRSLAKFSLGDRAGFHEDAGRALELSSSLPYDFMKIVITSIIKANMGDYQEALTDFERVRQLRPVDIDAIINCGIMRYKLDDFEGALKDFEQALTYFPQHFNIINCRGSVRYKLGDLKGALQDFDDLLKRTASHAPTFANRCLVKCRMGDLEGALEDFNSAFQLNTSDSATMYNFACFYALQGQADKSLYWLERAINVDPLSRDSARQDNHFDSIRSDLELLLA